MLVVVHGMFFSSSMSMTQTDDGLNLNAGITKDLYNLATFVFVSCGLINAPFEHKKN